MIDVSPNHTRTSEARRSSDARPARRALHFRVTDGPAAGATGEIASGKAIVGRAASADILVPDATVSQFHLELEATDAGIEVSDLGSHNGTHAGSVEIRAARVATGTEIRFGQSAMVVELGDPYRAELSKTTGFGSLVGSAPAMREVYALLERLARSDAHVILEGEPGTGKHSAARSLHDASRRAALPFVVLRCSGLPAQLAESALFGDGTRASVFDDAKGGTIVLDEVAELPREVQQRLADRVTARTAIEGVRIVSTSTRGLKQLVNGEQLLEELYLALAQARVRMPALVDRREDVKPLVLHFLGVIPVQTQAARSITPDALDAIAARPLRGNVRELRTIVERTALLADGPRITVDDLAFERLVAADRGSSPTSSPQLEDSRADDGLEPFKEAKRTVVDEFEKEYLARLLARAGTNISRAAALAGIERQSLRDLLKRHGLRGDDG